jgi:hypothetical protein
VARMATSLVMTCRAVCLRICRSRLRAIALKGYIQRPGYTGAVTHIH